MPAPDLDPISFRALEAVALLVAGISEANGYHTDLGMGRIVLDDEQLPEDDTDDSPATFIDAAEFTLDSSGRGFANSDMGITVEYVIPRGSRSAQPKLIAHRGCADLVRALAFKANDTTLPRCFRHLTLTGARLRGFSDEESGASYVIAQVTARAGLTELKSPAT